jgi:hypothetical protein
VIIDLNPSEVEDYRKFCAIKRLPVSIILGRRAWFPDEYASMIGVEAEALPFSNYAAPDWMFDYQAAITEMAIRKRKFAAFCDCGLGKTAILLEFARHAAHRSVGKRVLIVSPLMVVKQTIEESQKFYPADRGVGAYGIDTIPAAALQDWLDGNYGEHDVGITNYESIRPELRARNLGGLILDESSMLKSHYGKWGTKLIEMGRGVEWKLCCTGTPAPNDRIEYANHAVFLDQFSTVNAFLATYFVNRGQVDNRWELKPHALSAFYRAMAHWSIFLSNPATYGWLDNAETIPPINVHIHPVDMTPEQVEIMRSVTGSLFANEPGGITGRSKLGQLGKGFYDGESVPTLKPQFIKDELLESWKGESTIIWCLYNAEQDSLAKYLPGAVSLTGTTKHDVRQKAIDDFKAGRVKTLISKPKILGFGLNLQIATRHIFSGLQDSYESYYQCIKRSNRYGSTKPLNVHIPVTEIEEPMIQTVLRKSEMVQVDTDEQERLFRKLSLAR